LVTLGAGRAGIAHLPTGSLPGTPIVRQYWHDFLVQNQSSIAGRGLEIGSTKTIRRYGRDRLTSADALDLLPNPGVTYVTDLTQAWDVPAEYFDVFINQFTLHLIRDDLEALYHSIRVLRPGGTLLCNFACFSGFQAEGQDFGTGVRSYVWRWYTPPGVEFMLQRLGLGPDDFDLVSYGSYVGLLAYSLGIPPRSCPAHGSTGASRADPSSCVPE
jgi:SAM-dependent methyltransferase